MPRSVHVLTTALAATAVVTGVLAGGTTGTELSWLGVAGLLASLVVAGSLQLQVQHGRDVEGRDVEGLDVFDAVLVPAVFAMSGPAVVAAAAGAKLASQLWRRVAPVKARFNVAQWAAAAGAASLAFRGLGGRGVISVGEGGRLAVAMLVAAAVNHLAVVAVLRLAGTRSLRQVAADRASALRVSLAGGVANLALGVVFAAAWAAAPHLSVLFVVPLAMLHWANRGYAEARADRARLAGMERATGALHRPVDPRAALDDFLVEVRAAFEADAAELVLTGDDDALVLRRADERGASSTLARSRQAAAWRSALPVLVGAHRVVEGDRGPAAGVLAQGGWQRALIVPVRADEAVVGALCTYGRRGLEGFAEGELAVLEVLASEVGAALDKGRLLDEARRLADAEAGLREAAARLAAAQESEQRFRALVQHSSDVVAVTDADAVVRWSSLEDGSARTALGRLVPGVAWLDVVHPDDRAAARACLDALRHAPGPPQRLAHRARAADGGWRHVDTVATNLLDDPAVGGVVLNIRDVTEATMGQALLAGERHVLGLIARDEDLRETLSAVAAGLADQLPGAGVAVLLARDDGQPLVLTGRPLTEADRAALFTVAAELGVVGLPAGRTEAAASGADEIDLRERWCVSPIPGPMDPALLGCVAVRPPAAHPLSARDRDVVEVFTRLTIVAVERHLSRSDLAFRATHDALTGLPNRSMFLDRLAMALGRAARSQQWTSVLFCDLDGFKAVNDTFGHDAGDRLLVEVARRLEGAVRPGDTVARLGGDEFTLLCEGLDDPGQALLVAERVRHVLAEPHAVAGRAVSAPPSVGVAATRGQVPAERLLEQADAAMYQAKRRRGDRAELVVVGAQALP